MRMFITEFRLLSVVSNHFLERAPCKWLPRFQLQSIPIISVVMGHAHTRVMWREVYIRHVVPQAGIKGLDKQLHHTNIVGCNYLSLPLIPASGTTLLMCECQTSDSTGAIIICLKACLGWQHRNPIRIHFLFSAEQGHCKRDKSLHVKRLL